MFSNSKRRSETTPRATCRTLLIGAILLATAGTARAESITVKIENLGAPGSVFLTPFWIGAHNGAFDTYDLGAMASAFPGLEQIAEDGSWPKRCALSGYYRLQDSRGITYDGLGLRLIVSTPDAEFQGFALPILMLFYGRFQ